MHQSLKVRLLLALSMLGVAIYFLYPSLVYFSLNEKEIKEVRQNKDAFSNYVPSWVPKSHIVPGLDLQGGIHIVLGVDINKAITDRAARSLDRLVAFSKEQGVEIISSKQTGSDQTLLDGIEVKFASAADVDKFRDNVIKKFHDFVYVSSSGDTASLKLDPNMSQTIRDDAVNQTITTVTNRIDKLGVSEPSISKRGHDQVQIQLAGFDNPQAAKDTIGKTAQLRFQMVDEKNTFLKDLKDLPKGLELVNIDKDIHLSFNEEHLQTAKDFLAAKVPSDVVVKFGHDRNKLMRSYTLDRKIILTGDDLIDARVSPGSSMEPRPGVSLTFGPSGAKIFAQVTESSIGKRMAIVLEDIVDSAPVINSKIPDGNALISMGGAKSNAEMMADANQLALVLKSGALPAPVTFREERSVGPSLGKDSVEQGKIAFLVGSIIIILFMIYYYRLSGFISIIGVIFNMAFILATLSFLGGTITLPGVAALLLTIGVAVDSNVIINERIREELRLGKMPSSAVKAGYDSALSAIMDSNISTFIAGIVLWQFGTGAVQNFAMMLMVGTVSSVVTAIFITRIFFDLITSKGQKTLSI